MRNIIKPGIYFLLLTLSLTPSAFAFQTKADEIEINSPSLSNQDELTMKLYQRAMDFGKKHFSKFTCQIVDHSIHFVVFDDTEYRDPIKPVLSKYKALAQKAKIAVYFDCLFLEFLMDHFIKFWINGPNYEIPCNYRLSDLAGTPAYWSCCEVWSKLDSFTYSMNRDSSIHWSRAGYTEDCILFGEVSPEIAKDKRLQNRIADSISNIVFDNFYIDAINDYIFLAYHYISINLTFKGKLLDCGKLDRPLSDFIKKNQKSDYDIIENLIKRIKVNPY